MDTEAEGRKFFGQFDGMVGGGHIGHNGCACQDTFGVCLDNSLVDAFAEPEVVGVYYQSFFHLGASLRGLGIVVNLFGEVETADDKADGEGEGADEVKDNGDCAVAVLSWAGVEMS